MRIVFSPYVPNAQHRPVLAAHRQGDILIVNGVPHDFAGIAPGEAAEGGAAQDVSRAWRDEGGRLTVVLRLPHSETAGSAMTYPDPVDMTGDGPVPIPTEGAPVPAGDDA